MALYHCREAGVTMSDAEKEQREKALASVKKSDKDKGSTKESKEGRVSCALPETDVSSVRTT